MKILAVTGIRSDYDILYPVLDELRSGGNNIRIVVSGAHLSDFHKNTWKRIEEDGFEISDKIDSLFSTDRKVQRSKGAGALIQGLATTVEREEPDFLLMVGDREESISTALVGNYMEKLVLHIGGGDTVFGNSDDPMRFAVSKLAHVHCCTANEYAENLLRIGEEEFRVFWTGNPAYVNIDNTKVIPKNDLFMEIGLENDSCDYVVLIKHPLSSEVDNSHHQMKIALEALEVFFVEKKYHTICIQPNSDPGSFDMLEVIKEYRHKKWFHFAGTLHRDTFVNLIRYAKALVGNSSMGILEAPHYKLPVVNVGNRQKGRLNAGNVKFVDYNIDEIVSALKIACLDEDYRRKIQVLKNPYGDGTAARKVREVMESVDLNDRKWYIKEKLC